MQLRRPALETCLICCLKAEARRLRCSPPPRAAYFSTSGRHRAEKQSSKVRKIGVKSYGSVEGLERRSDNSLRIDKSILRREVTGEGLKAVVHQRLDRVKNALQASPLLEGLRLDEESFEEAWKRYGESIEQSIDAGSTKATKGPSREAQGILQVYKDRGEIGLDAHLKYGFYAYVSGSQNTQADIAKQKALADLRYPTEWYPFTRMSQRKIHLHVGPTNSGKTYHALKRLEEAKTGLYAGPLRLLAHEVYTRLNAKGRKCWLITGEERRPPEDQSPGTIDMTSCTVEMVPVNKDVDVAVIDEIQMIGNEERGWAWTQALLAVKAKEVHLCGEERTVPLICELAAAMGDDVEVHRYERLSPLEVAPSSLNGDLTKLQKGDCVVSFSIMSIHALRREIERTTGKKVAIVYGSLPPETRAQQARLFNDPDNEYDILVASDAIGMGLNL